MEQKVGQAHQRNVSGWLTPLERRANSDADHRVKEQQAGRCGAAGIAPSGRTGQPGQVHGPSRFQGPARGCSSSLRSVGRPSGGARKGHAPGSGHRARRGALRRCRGVADERPLPIPKKAAASREPLPAAGPGAPGVDRLFGPLRTGETGSSVKVTAARCRSEQYRPEGCREGRPAASGSCRHPGNAPVAGRRVR